MQRLLIFGQKLNNTLLKALKTVVLETKVHSLMNAEQKRQIAKARQKKIISKDKY
jgi:hypothetical protein